MQVGQIQATTSSWSSTSIYLKVREPDSRTVDLQMVIQPTTTSLGTLMMKLLVRTNSSSLTTLMMTLASSRMAWMSLMETLASKPKTRINLAPNPTRGPQTWVQTRSVTSLVSNLTWSLKTRSKITCRSCKGAEQMAQVHQILMRTTNKSKIGTQTKRCLSH